MDEKTLYEMEAGWAYWGGEASEDVRQLIAYAKGLREQLAEAERTATYNAFNSEAYAAELAAERAKVAELEGELANVHEVMHALDNDSADAERERDRYADTLRKIRERLEQPANGRQATVQWGWELHADLTKLIEGDSNA